MTDKKNMNINPVFSETNNYCGSDNSFSLLKIIQLSQNDIQKEKSKPAKEVFSILRKKYGHE